MSNIMQYLIQLGDEFRASYERVDARIDQVQDDLLMIKNKLDGIEYWMHPNRRDSSDTLDNKHEEKQYNK